MLKKWSFDWDFWDGKDIIVFAESEEEALEMVNKKLWGDDIKSYWELDDYEVQELAILHPEKAYKGCYIDIDYSYE